jgi:prepilin-type processing-associated H-X9-DG protein
MTSKASCISIVLVLLLVVPALGQAPATEVPPPAPAKPAPAAPAPQAAAGETDVAELMRQMGADDEAIMFVQLMSQVMGEDLGQMMLLMMLAGEGKMNDDFIGMMLFMKALQGGAKQPIALLDGNALLVIEDGTVYRINGQTLKLEGSVAYRAKKGADILPALMPLIGTARNKALATQSMSNMKQLCMAAQMYAAEAGGMLPTDQWPDQLGAYIKNRALYRAPGVPGKEVGYAINEAVIGAVMADIKRPAQTVLFFESDPAHELPFGGADAIIRQPQHGGQIVVGFVDGHARLVTPEELRQLLAQDPFR